MKTVKIFILMLLCGYLFSCKHDDSSSPSGAAMSATVNGSNVNLSASFTNSNGVTVLEGTNNTCTIMIYLQLTGPATYYSGFQGPGSYPYATVSTSSVSGTCTTNANDGTLNITTGSSSGLYSGTFSFTAYGNSTISVTNGQFTNL